MPAPRPRPFRRRRLLPLRAAALLTVASTLGAAAGAPLPAPVPRSPAPTALRTGPLSGPGAERDAVVLPVDGPVVRLFVRPAQRWSRGHRGVDLAAEPGAPVRAPLAGVVEFAGPVAGRTVLTIVRADGLRASLEPLSDVLEVGTPVTPGDVVGLVATPTVAGDAAHAGARGHCAPTSCVHWGVRRDGEYVDPLGLLEPVTVVLLPWR